MSSNKYEEPQDGEWFDVPRQGHRNACCDCGLVHCVDYRVVNGKFQVRVRRNERATVAMRRSMRRLVVVVPA